LGTIHLLIFDGSISGPSFRIQTICILLLSGHLWDYLDYQLRFIARKECHTESIKLVQAAVENNYVLNRQLIESAFLGK